MVSILVCYGTGEGQTAKVADRIVEVLAERGHDATARNAGDVSPDLTVEEFDADFAAFVEGRLGVAPPESSGEEGLE